MKKYVVGLAIMAMALPLTFLAQNGKTVRASTQVSAVYQDTPPDQLPDTSRGPMDTSSMPKRDTSSWR